MFISRFATHWDDWSDAFSAFDAFRHEVERTFRDNELHAQMKDSGDAYVVKAFVPGLDEKQLKLSLTDDVLTLTAERTASPPKDYTTHRKERGDYRVARSFSFPARVDPERVTAELKNGALTVRVQKAEAEKPRQITIKTR
jgi:HSP20 family protein